jgi:hypothetical protein
MKKIVKKIFKNIWRFIKEIGFFMSWLFYLILIHKRTSRLKNYSEKVIIVGNGPSAKTFDYQKFISKGYDLLCVNFFALDQELFFTLKPRYYCIIDPAFFLTEEQMKYPEMTQLFEVFERVDWKLNLVILSWQKLQINNKYIEFSIINCNRYMGNNNFIQKVLYTNNIGTFGYQNVIHAALYYLITAKVKKIGMIGVENDWHRELYVTKDNEVIREDRHFYGTQRINLTQRGEIKKGQLYLYFYYYYVTLQKYTLIANYAKLENTNIINYCVESYIDVFEKRDQFK